VAAAAAAAAAAAVGSSIATIIQESEPTHLLRANYSLQLRRTECYGHNTMSALLSFIMNIGRLVHAYLPVGGT
jgi:hypothetical protein